MKWMNWERGDGPWEFACYFHRTGWNLFSLGVNIDVTSPNFEIHLPFGFIRCGMVQKTKRGTYLLKCGGKNATKRTWGYNTSNFERGMSEQEIEEYTI